MGENLKSHWNREPRQWDSSALVVQALSGRMAKTSQASAKRASWPIIIKVSHLQNLANTEFGVLGHILYIYAIYMPELEYEALRHSISHHGTLK